MPSMPAALLSPFPETRSSWSLVRPRSAPRSSVVTFPMSRRIVSSVRPDKNDRSVELLTTRSNRVRPVRPAIGLKSVMLETGLELPQSPVKDRRFRFVSPATGVMSLIAEGQGRVNSSRLVISPRLSRSASVTSLPERSNCVRAVLYSSPAMVTLGARASATAFPPPSDPPDPRPPPRNVPAAKISTAAAAMPPTSRGRGRFLAGFPASSPSSAGWFWFSPPRLPALGAAGTSTSL